MNRIVTGAAAALLAFATGSATGVTPPNFELQAPPRALPTRAAAAKAPAPARFHWADARGPALPLSPLGYDKRPEAAARSALHGAASSLNLTAESADAAELRELHDLGRGPVIARYQQRHNGLPVFGAQVNVIMDRGLKPIAYSGSFVKTPPAAAPDAPVARSAPNGGFALGTDAATQAALRDLGRASKAPGLNLLHAPAKVDRMYYSAGAGGLVPAYRLAIRAAQADGAGQYAYGYLVSAVDGTILVRKNLMADADFTYRAYADTTTPFKPYDGPLGNGRTPFLGAGPGDNPPRVPAASNLVTLEAGPISTGDPWQADNATTTLGNSVRAYTDLTSPDGIGGDAYAPTTATRTFNYASTADADPSGTTARRAGIVNMFFIMSWLHDFWYDHGVDEASGNAQLDNFGRGGAEGDPILAESQDFSGRNNANMFTPPDGDSPVMQMYLFDGGASSLDVTSPDLGGFLVGTAEFGDQDFALSDDLAAVDDGVDTGTDGCTAFVGVTGLIALIDRGNCNFTVKAANAQAAGAVGALIVNNVPNDGAPGMSGDDATITIPVLSISFEDGEQIRAELAGGPVSVTMSRSAGIDRDAALDNGIIAHEYFHYVSNRLVNDAFGLINQQGGGMGEGWSDFASMMLFVRPEDQGLAGNDTWAGIYSTGVYVDSSAYFGVRRAPYSTDFAVNPLTFQHIQDGVPLPLTAPFQFGASGEFNSEVHSTGEVWALMLWEAYAALLNDPRHTFDEAQSRMQDYVIAGLKVLPQSPTFVEARDGILAAARATDLEDFEVIAEAFARRGIGAGALAPDRDSTDNVGVTESYVAFAAQFAIEDFDIDFLHDDGTVGYCDTDQALDPGETALLSFTVVSNGTLDLAAGATIQVSTDGDATLPDGGLVTLPALAVGATHAVSMPITLNSAGGTAEPLELTLAFPEAGGTPDEVFEPATITQVLNVNLDLGPTRDFDDMEFAEAAATDWQVQLVNPASGPPWVIEDLDATFGTGQVWYAHDNGTTSSSRLTTPEFAVTGAFSMTFDHYFEFEEPDIFDGGVMEISINGGAFVDVTAAGGSFGAGQGYNGVAQTPFPSPRAAWVGTNGAMETVTLSFGDALAGDTARIRFRLEADESVGAFGWVVDNVSLNGISAPVFSGVVAEDDACENFVPLVDAGADQAVDEGAMVSLTGTVSDRNGDTLAYAWTRVSGPAITINNATTLTPTFTAPNVSGNSSLTLRLTASDGTDSVTDDVVVTVQNVGGGGGGGGGALGGELVLAGLLVLLRRRRIRRL
jgi:hypothetical protein